MVLLYWESPNGEKSYRIDSKSNKIFLGSDPRAETPPLPLPCKAGSLITASLRGKECLADGVTAKDANNSESGILWLQSSHASID